MALKNKNKSVPEGEAPLAAHEQAPPAAAEKAVPGQAEAGQAEGGAEQAEKAVPQFSLKLDYLPDGVYMELLAEGRLSIAEQEQVMVHLMRKRIEQLDVDATTRCINMADGQPERIAPPQTEYVYDEQYVVSIAEDAMSASIMLTPPEEGRGRRLDFEILKRELATVHRITFGVNEAMLKMLLAYPKYEEQRVLARGIPPKHGEDGRLEWHFEQRDAQDSYRVVQVEGDENIDYKNLDLFEKVEKDQLLVTRIPPKDGKNGRTVTGREVPWLQGKNYQLPKGRHTYITPDGLELRAQVAGRVDVVKGHVDVSSTYVVKGDVDMSIGNIDFDGDVVVNGNVFSDFSIKATGNIEVMGMVEASTLEAGGDIIVRGGVQGAKRGQLIAQQGVYVRFAEYTLIHAEKIVAADSILHSDVNCTGAIEVLGGRGCIVGGVVCAGSYIAANRIGAMSGCFTEVCAGVTPAYRQKLTQAEEMVDTLTSVMEKLKIAVESDPDDDAPPQVKQARMQMVRDMLKCKNSLAVAEEELAKLKKTVEDSNGGQIHVMQAVYPGTLIVLGMAHLRIKDLTKYATYRINNEEVELTNCRFKPSRATARPKRR